MEISIKIPRNLSPKEEKIALVKALVSSNLIGLPENVTIGEGVNVVNHNYTINVIREDVKNVIATKVCSNCNIIFELTLSTYCDIEHNYGGKKKRLRFCSKECATNAVLFIGPRSRVIHRRKKRK